MLSNVTRYGLLISSMLMLGCGGSEFQTNDTLDASAGSGGSSGSAGTGGTGGASGAAGAGGTATGGTGGVGGTGGTGTGGVAGTGGSATCETVCAPLPPLGWDGPAVLLMAPSEEPPPACDGYYGQSVNAAIEGITWDPPQCVCECSTDKSKAVLDSFSGINCTASPCGTVVLQQGQCTGGPSTCSGAIGRLRVNMPPETCASSVTVNKEEIKVERNATVCVGAPPNLSGCADGEFCDVDAPGPRCIFRQGDVPCPDGEFNKRSVIFQSFEDQRKCSDCSCGLPGVAGKLEVYGGNSCGSFLTEFAVPTDCVTAPTTTNGFSYRFTSENVASMCQPTSVPTAVNDVVLEQPMTVCCR